MKKKEVGRPSELDNEQFLLKIKELVLEGKTEKEMQEILDIPSGTWDYWKWKNYHGIVDKLLEYKHARILMKAEANVEVLLESEDERVMADMTKFSLETLGKDKGYSKRTEMTGKDGKELKITFDSSFQK
jgi:hypothetical protein